MPWWKGPDTQVAVGEVTCWGPVGSGPASLASFPEVTSPPPQASPVPVPYPSLQLTTGPLLCLSLLIRGKLEGAGGP